MASCKKEDAGGGGFKVIVAFLQLHFAWGKSRRPPPSAIRGWQARSSSAKKKEQIGRDCQNLLIEGRQQRESHLVRQTSCTFTTSCGRRSKGTFYYYKISCPIPKSTWIANCEPEREQKGKQAGRQTNRRRHRLLLLSILICWSFGENEQRLVRWRRRIGPLLFSQNHTSS